MTVSRAEWRLRLQLLLFWLVPAAMGTVGFSLVPSRLNPDLSTPGIILSQLCMWGGWACWTLIIWMTGDYLRAARSNRITMLLTYVLLGMVVIVTQIFVQTGIAVAFGMAEPRGVESTLVIGIRSYGDYFVVLYCAIVVAQLAMQWYANWQSERVMAARMGQDLAQAQLRALQAQLNPHFLFNALNSIVTLIGREPALAQQLVVRLADLLRATLRAGDRQEIPLAQELELTRRYLDIERVRFADRLRVEWPAPPIPTTMVPAFALQPLVENALLHGIARRAEAGTVSVTVSQQGDMLELVVRDTGPGLSPTPSPHGTGTGLANLRDRLMRLYGDRASLTLHDRGGSGTDAVLRLPIVSVADNTAPDVFAGMSDGSGMHSTLVTSSDVPARR